MKKAISFALLASIFLIHSAKAETNQRTKKRSRAMNAPSTETKKLDEFTQKTTTTMTTLVQTPQLTPPPLMQQSIMQQTTSTLTGQSIVGGFAPTSHIKSDLNLFVSKIDFTQEGVTLFLQQTVNNKQYPTTFLPYSMTHLVQFLDFAHATKQGPEFIEGAFRLFGQKIKGCPYIAAPALERFMDQATPYLERECAKKPFSLWQEFKHTLSEVFREKFAVAKDDPLGFFEYVAKNLAQQVNDNITAPDRLRGTTLRYFISSTDKVIWCPSDQFETWQSFKKLGDSFHKLHVKQVIPDELDANELTWSLIERYCHFLKLAGTQLTPQTCIAIRKDLAEQTPVWLASKEQEENLQPKKDRLFMALMETEARIHAKEQGIVTDLIPVYKKA